MNQLVEDRGPLETDTPSQLHVEIFVGNGGEMSTVQPSQRVDIGARFAAESHATQILLQLRRIS
jgi:hypothetical protein